MIVRFILRSRKVSLVVQGDDHPPHEVIGNFQGNKEQVCSGACWFTQQVLILLSN